MSQDGIFGRGPDVSPRIKMIKLCSLKFRAPGSLPPPSMRCRARGGLRGGGGYSNAFDGQNMGYATEAHFRRLPMWRPTLESFLDVSLLHEKAALEIRQPP